MRSWDPYPFILLNLALSILQAAYAAPVIMMSQNRQQDIDRKAAENDYKINVKAELEIELLHEKIDQLRAQEVLKLTEAVRSLTELLQQSAETPTSSFPWTASAPPRVIAVNRFHNMRLSTPWRKVISPSAMLSGRRAPSCRPRPRTLVDALDTEAAGTASRHWILRPSPLQRGATSR